MALALGAAVSSCKARDEGPRGLDEKPRAPAEAVARALALDASEIAPAVDPPAAAGDLGAEIEGFTSLDDCVRQRAHVDPLVGDALEAIGYDTFLRDACRVLDAAKAGDARRCRPIEASSLRTRCEVVVAEVRGSPDACPWDFPGRPARGRDAACVAIASRDARLCAAEADPVGRAGCEAIVRRDPSGCARLFSRDERDRCARGAARWRTALPEAARAGGGAIAAEGTLHVEAKGVAPGAADVDLKRELARGVVVVEERDGVRFVLGTLSDDGPGFVAPPPHADAAFGAEVFVPARAAIPPDGGPSAAPNARVERAELLMPGRAPLASSSATSATPGGLTARVEALGRERGGAVAIAIDGTIDGPNGGARIHATATTFVRDRIAAADVFHGAPRQGSPDR